MEFIVVLLFWGIISLEGFVVFNVVFFYLEGVFFSFALMQKKQKIKTLNIFIQIYGRIYLTILLLLVFDEPHFVGFPIAASP
jgi:hypothetical protein